MLRRLKIVKGQIAGLERQVVADAYCVDVITQSLAIKQALSTIEDLLLERHLTNHVVENVKAGRHRRAIEELIKLYKLSKHK